MTIGSILLGVALLALVALYVGRPLVEGRRRPTGLVTAEQRLAAHKEALLVHIQALDFDFETGKIPAADYEAQRAELIAETTAVLKEIDALAETPADMGRGPAAGVDAEIEAAIARHRRTAAFTAPDTRARAGQGNGRSRFCPACGEAADPDDKFCAHCGQALVQAQPT